MPNYSPDEIPAPPNELIRECGESYMRSNAGIEEVKALRPLCEWGYQQGIAKGDAKIQAAVDAELEACCEWLFAQERVPGYIVVELRAARRLKPPSLKQQALAQLEKLYNHHELSTDTDAILSALKTLPDEDNQ